MTRFAMVVLPLVLLAGSSSQDDAVKKELAKLNGDWRVVRGEENGAPISDYIVEHLKWSFKGDQLIFAGIEPLIDRASQLKITLDPTASPRCIDLKVVVGADKGAVWEGIYRWRGDELEICLAVPDGVPNRPLEFETKGASNRVLFTIARKKN